MRKALYIFLMFAVLAVVTGCTGKGGAKQEAQPKDTVYTQEAAMAVYDYDPVRALRMVDSAVIVGNMSPWWAEKNRARIYCQTRAGVRMDSLLGGSEGVRFDSARAIGERLLQHDSIKNSLEGQQDVLEILAYTARRQNDSTAWLLRSRQLVDVCRRQGAETEALRNEAEVGAALCRMGRQSEGLAVLDSVIASLSPIDHLPLNIDHSAAQSDSVVKSNGQWSMFNGQSFKFNELDAYIVAAKRKIGVLAEAGREEETLPLARRITELIDDYEAHPERYHDGSYREPPAEKREDYIRFYRTQAQEFITAAYAALAGRGSMTETFERIERSAREAAMSGHQARYRALQQQMEAEARAAREQVRADNIRQQAVFFFVLLVLAVAFSIVLYRKNRDIRQKNRVLAQQLLELYDNTRPKEREEVKVKSEEFAAAVPLPDEGAALSPEGNSSLFTIHSSLDAEELYRHIRDEVTRLQLYTDPGFGRQSVVERFHLTKDQAGRVFSQGSEHGSISSFITDCRLDHARRLLVSRPDMGIGEIAAASGFGVPKSFTRSFKARYGLTPTEFREQ